jgi:AcrB/AcrD/AcrF family
VCASRRRLRAANLVGLFASGNQPFHDKIVRRYQEQGAGSITKCNTYLPLFAFDRIEARLFYPMVYAVGFAQLGALLLALTLVPGLAYLAYRRPRRVFHNHVLGWIEVGYRRMLHGSLRRPGIVYLMTAGATVMVVGLAMTVSREFLPELDEGGLFLHGEMVGGISLQKASEMDAELRKVVLEFPEISTIVNHIGRNDDGTDPNTPSHMEALIVLRPYDTWPAGETKQDLVRRMRARLAELPGYELAFSQPILDSMKDKIFEPHSQLAVKIFGNDFNELRRIGKDTAKVLETVPGTTEVLVDDRPPLPQITITPDREAAARYGINVADITDLIQSGIGGGAVSQVFIGDRHYDVTVRFDVQTRSSPEAIGNLVLTSSTGALIPLSQVARIKLQQGESTINRDMNRRYLMVKFDSSGRSLPALLADAKRAVADKVSFDPKNYSIEWIGHFEDEQRAEALDRPFRGRAAGRGALHSDPRPDPRTHDRPTLCRVRFVAPSGLDFRCRAAGHPRRADRAPRHWGHSECGVRDRLHCAVRGRRHERRHHGGKSQSDARFRHAADRRRGGRGRRTPAPRSHDCDRRHGRHAAGGFGNGGRQRCATQSCHRRDRRPDAGDAFDFLESNTKCND